MVCASICPFMGRFHAIEFEDFEWFPAVFRDSMTDFFNFNMTRMDLYAPVVPLLAEAFKRTGATHIVDLCSGGGGPYLRLTGDLSDALGRPVPITLTDKYPNVTALGLLSREVSAINYSPEPVDATSVPVELNGFRTLFSSFHHFSPEAARAILQDAVDQGTPIGIFEIVNRDLSAFFQVGLGGLLGLFVMTPLLRPLRLSRFVFTYLIPAIPFFTLWDGVASNLRAYDPEDLQALVDSLDGAERYEWNIGRKKGPVMVKVTHLIGMPR